MFEHSGNSLICIQMPHELILDFISQTYTIQVLRGHTTSVRDVAFSPTGRHIASAALDGEVKLWSALNGSQVRKIFISVKLAAW